MSAFLAYFVLPAVLLVLGVPIFLVLLVTCLAVILFVADVPTETVQTFLFSGLDNFPLLACRFSCWPARSWHRAGSRGGWRCG